MTSHEPTITGLQAELEALKDLCTDVQAVLDDDRDFDGAVSRLNEALNGGALTPDYERIGGLLAIAAAQDEQVQFLAAFAAGLQEMADGGAAQLAAIRDDLAGSGGAGDVGWLCRELLSGIVEPRACRVCGCTDDDCSGCIERTGEPCSWVGEDLCSACDRDTSCSRCGERCLDFATIRGGVECLLCVTDDRAHARREAAGALIRERAAYEARDEMARAVRAALDAQPHVRASILSTALALVAEPEPQTMGARAGTAPRVVSEEHLVDAATAAMHTLIDATSSRPVNLEAAHQLATALGRDWPPYQVDNIDAIQRSPDWITVPLKHGRQVTFGRYSGRCTLSGDVRTLATFVVPVSDDDGMIAAARAAARDDGDPCTHPGSNGPCIPRIADGNCIWCERELPRACAVASDCDDGDPCTTEGP